MTDETFLPLSLEDIAGLSAPSNNPQKRSTRKKNDLDLNERTFETWFGLKNTFFGNCDNPDCIDERPDQSRMEGKVVVAKVNNKVMCRFCFLGGWNKDE